MSITYKSIINNPKQYNAISGKVKMTCEFCNNIFLREKGTINQAIKRGETHSFCSLKCYGKNKVVPLVKLVCSYCKKNIEKTRAEIRKNKTGRFFCSKSCAATYNNTHKTHGTRRSKLEVWLSGELPKLYPSLEIYFNRRDTINSELDIYIPSLNLAFELNGIFHYEPIYGQDKLASIRNNDRRKFQACLEQNIELCIIDTSKEKYFKSQRSQKYLDIIVNIINIKRRACPI